MTDTVCDTAQIVFDQWIHFVICHRTTESTRCKLIENGPSGSNVRPAVSNSESAVRGILVVAALPNIRQCPVNDVLGRTGVSSGEDNPRWR